MSWVFGNSVQGKSANTDTVSVSLNVTGNNVLIAAIADADYNIATSTFTDTASNSYTLINPTGYDNTGQSLRALIYWTNNKATGSLTFTYTNTTAPDILGCICVMAFSNGGGVTTRDQALATNSANTMITSQGPGTITPAQPNELFITSCGFGESISSPSVSLGTITGNENLVSGLNFGFLSSYYIQGNSTGVNPTFSWTGGSVTAIVGASFIAPPIPFINRKRTYNLSANVKH